MSQLYRWFAVRPATVQDGICSAASTRSASEGASGASAVSGDGGLPLPVERTIIAVELTAARLAITAAAPAVRCSGALIAGIGPGPTLSGVTLYRQARYGATGTKWCSTALNLV